MTYRPCCPQKTYPQQRCNIGGLSPSALHTGTRTWAGYNQATPGVWVSGDWGIDIDTGDTAYNLFHQGSPSELSSPFTFGPIARDHAGQHYFLYSRSQTSQDVAQEATLFDLPDVIGGHHTGVYTFELVTVPAGGWSTMVASTELVHDEGIVTSHSFPSYRTWNDFAVSGLDWSPFEDCLYAILVHRDSGHELASIQPTSVNDGYDPPAGTVELWRIRFNGTHDVVWTLDTSSYNNGSGPITVASDGAVWFSTYTSSQKIWRLYGGVVSEVVPDDGPYTLSGTAFGATPWGDVLVPYQTGSGFSAVQHMMMLSPDGGVIDFPCAEITGSNFTNGMMRQEDFMRLFVFVRLGNFAVTQQLYEIDWKRCGAGWKVGGM